MVAGNGLRSAAHTAPVKIPALVQVLKLRTATAEECDELVEGVEDAVVAARNDALLAVYRSPAPTMEDVGKRWANLPFDQRAEIFCVAMLEYEAYDADIFNLVRPALDISGAYAKSDRKHIQRTFRARQVVHVRFDCAANQSVWHIE